MQGKVQAAEATGLGWAGENGLDSILLTVKSQGPRQGLSKGETSSGLMFLNCSCTLESPEELLEHSIVGLHLRPVKSERTGNCRSSLWQNEKEMGSGAQRRG